MLPTTLTKTRLKLALECPRKLVYEADARYTGTLADDEFREALVRGGHAVGELARRMYPDCVRVEGRSSAEQIRETEALLKSPRATLAEATFGTDNLLVRVDVLVKENNDVQLIEVKSKSFDGRRNSMCGKNGRIRSEWLTYIQDVAFQTYVLRRCHPEWSVTPHLMLIDPNARCSVDSLGTLIRVTGIGRDLAVAVDPNLHVEAFVEPLLRRWNVASEVDQVLAGEVETPEGMVAFTTHVASIAAELDSGRSFSPRASHACRTCEFYCPPEERSEERRSGWTECVGHMLGRGSELARCDSVFALHRDSGSRKGRNFLAGGRLALSEIGDDELDVEIREDRITTSQRQLLQVQATRNGGPTRFLQASALRNALGGLRFPLHFLDFETARPVLPFQAGRRPNQQIVFQFSHHVLNAAGRLVHADQCLVATPGTVPNVPVLRALRDALGKDSGTVIHWWDHERNVLDDLRSQLKESREDDCHELSKFIDTLLDSPKGDGRLFDLGRLVQAHAFFAGTSGGSSIKKVLPAVLAQSPFLQQRYTQPIYGGPDLPSHNFGPGWIWLRQNGTQWIDPYKLLDPLYSDPQWQAVLVGSSEEEEDGFIHNGGGAMVAYGDLQRPELTPGERERYERQLLRYCELDTLAMVMVYEALREWVALS